LNSRFSIGLKYNKKAPCIFKKAYKLRVMKIKEEKKKGGKNKKNTCVMS